MAGLSHKHLCFTIFSVTSSFLGTCATALSGNNMDRVEDVVAEEVSLPLLLTIKIIISVMKKQAKPDHRWSLISLV